MQANFESRLNTYLPLLSDQDNSCNFLTTLFHRVWHFIRNREWVADKTILERFQASIEAPTEKTKEIYQLFLNRVGPSAILDNIQELIKASEYVRPAMKMTHSRFSASLWDYASARSVAGMLFPTISFLTEEGERLNAEEKEQLKILTETCMNSNTLLNRAKLYEWMINIEKPEREQFKNLLSSHLDRILNGASTAELKLDLRKFRKFLINHGHRVAKSDCGDSSSIYIPLLKLLYPSMNTTSKRCKDKTLMEVKNNRIYIPNADGEAASNWSAGFVIGHAGHATTYVFDGTDYQWLDNGRKPIKISAQDLLEHIKKIKLDTSWDYYLISESAEPNNYPVPANWSYPDWERNNCFVASGLVLLAMVKFYQNQS